MKALEIFFLICYFSVKNCLCYKMVLIHLDDLRKNIFQVQNILC